MENEKDLLNEDIVEETPVDDVVEEVVDEVVNEVEEIIDTEISEDTEVAVEDVIEDAVEEVEEVIEKKELSKAAVSVISVVATLVVVLVGLFVVYKTSYNKYNSNNDGYAQTIEQAAKTQGMTAEELMEQYSLPSDMKSDTVWGIAQLYMPISLVAEQYGMSFEEFKAIAGIDAAVTGDTAYGRVMQIMSEKAEAEMESYEEDAATLEEEENAEEAVPAEEAAPLEGAEVPEEEAAVLEETAKSAE